jgi:hypothetical protein
MRAKVTGVEPSTRLLLFAELQGIWDVVYWIDAMRETSQLSPTLDSRRLFHSRFFSFSSGTTHYYAVFFLFSYLLADGFPSIHISTIFSSSFIKKNSFQKNKTIDGRFNGNPQISRLENHDKKRDFHLNCKGKLMWNEWALLLLYV